MDDPVYNRRSIDLNLLAMVALLLCIGVLMVFSASFVRAQQQLGDPYYYLKRQILWLIVGTSAMVVVSQIQYWHWRNMSRLLLMATFITLVLVLLPGVGAEEGGGRRWISLGPVGFQPSEFAKLALVIYFAHYFSRSQPVIRRFWPVFGVFGSILGAVFALIMKQPDLGTAVTIGGTSLVLLFTAGARMGYVAGIGLSALPLVAYLIYSEPYRLRRLVAFMNPEADPLDSGYQIIQSLYALGSGSLFGVGFFEGRQKFFYLPAQHTDFIYAVLGEELGFVGGVAVILLFAAFAWRGYRIAVGAPDIFGCLLATGLTTMIVLQAIINMGVVTASMPVTGISLPFISYGGSSLVFTLVAVGILLNISKYARV